MKKLLILSIVLFCFVIKVGAQTDLNNYKYVVVPLQYDFLKGEDVYRLNTLTKFLFKEEGFDVYFNKQALPDDLFKDRCLAIYVDVKSVKGGFRRTRLQIVLNDCRGELIMKSDVGDSGENNYQKSHQTALRNAFEAIKRLNYKYKPKLRNVLKSKQGQTKKESEAVEIVKSEKVIETNSEVIEKKSGVEKTLITNKSKSLLFAKIIDNGFQIIDENKDDVMILLNTAAKNVFIVKAKDAIVFKENDKWIYSENTGDVMVRKFLNIKF